MAEKILVFYGAQFVNQDSINEPKNIPDGAWVKMRGQWYIKDHGALMLQKKESIPNEIKAKLLLLDEKP